MKKIYSVLMILWFASGLFAQNKTSLILGKVSYVSAQNIYVKFDHTDLISAGDTLFTSKGMNVSPCLMVKQKSSSSCVCIQIADCELDKGAEVFFKSVVIEEPKEEEPKVDSTSLIPKVKAVNKARVVGGRKEKIRGRISAATYSGFSSERGDRHRMMYRFSLGAKHIKDSKFSLDAYLNYRQNFIPTDQINGQKTKFFRVYNLAVKYDVDSTLSLLVGRKINNKASSLGAIDGLQGEKLFGQNYVGLIAGFRPDIYKYDFNPNLFQYGVYLGRRTNTKRIYAQTTIGFLEQRNVGKIDRRYLYFQHSSTLYKNINLFASAELDVYNMINNQPTGSARLTNLYVSARYKFKRWINFSVSYDKRKRILYYETFKTEIERLLDDDEARQGLRFRVNIKPLKYVNIGASYSKRFQSSRQNKSDNINGFASLSKIPGIGGRLSVSFNMNSSNYLESKIISLRHSRTIIKKKLSTYFYFRRAQYQYLGSETQTELAYYGANLSYKINRSLSFSVLGEMAVKSNGERYRMNAKLIKHFDNKKRK